MKKKIIISAGIAVVLLVVGFFAYQQYTFAKLNPKNNLGVAQVLKNDTGKEKVFNVEKTGYYDVKTLSADRDYVMIGAPKVNETIFGSFYKKGERLIMLGSGEVRLLPATLKSLEVSKDKFEIHSSGDYYAEMQIPAGKYKIQYDGELKDIIGGKEGIIKGEASISVEKISMTPDKHSSGEQISYAKFTTEKKEGMLTIEKNTKIHLKTTNENNYKVILNKI